MKGIGFFQNLRIFLNFEGIFRRIFLEEFFWRNFLGGFLWEDFFMEEFFVYIFKEGRRRRKGKNLNP